MLKALAEMREVRRRERRRRRRCSRTITTHLFVFPFLTH